MLKGDKGKEELRMIPNVELEWVAMLWGAQIETC